VRPASPQSLSDQGSILEPLLTAAEVGELLGLPRASVYDLARRDEERLGVVHLGKRRIRFRRAAIAAILASA